MAEKTSRVTSGKTPRRGKTPIISELKLFWQVFFYQPMRGQHTGKKQCSCYFSLEKYRQK